MGKKPKTKAKSQADKNTTHITHPNKMPLPFTMVFAFDERNVS